MDYNKFIGLGWLLTEPYPKTTSGGKRIVKFKLGIKNEKQDVDEIPCQAWERTAERIEMFLKVGSRVFIEGAWKATTYEDDMGEKKSSNVCNINRIIFLDHKENE